MNNFTFHIPTKMIFGRDCIDQIGDELKSSGKKVLLVYGGGSIKKSGLLDKIKDLLSSDMEVFELPGIEPNPKMKSIREGVAACKNNDIDMVLAVGGGSVIDASKAIAAGACVDFDPWEFFGAPRRAVEKALPLYTVVTMASTGSEMTCGAVISNEDTLEKTGRAGFPLFPKASFLDPTLTFTVPKYQTACGAADILSHICESYFKKESNSELLDRMMEGAMKAVISSSKNVMNNPDDYEARGDLLWTASWAINGFFAGGSRQAWSCHPIEHELSARFDITHGLGLAILMPKWLSYCLKTDPDTEKKICEFGKNVFGVDSAEQAISALENYLFKDLGLNKSLSEIGLSDLDTKDIAASICKNGSINGFCSLDESAVQEILEACI